MRYLLTILLIICTAPTLAVTDVPLLLLQRPYAADPPQDGPLFRMLRREDQTQISAGNHFEINEVQLDQGREDHMIWMDWTKDSTIHIGSQTPASLSTASLTNASSTISVASTVSPAAYNPVRNYTWPNSSGVDYAGQVNGAGSATPQKFKWSGRTATTFTGVVWQDPAFSGTFNSGAKVIYVGGANRSSPNHHRIRSITTGIKIEGPLGGFTDDAHTLGIINNTDQTAIRVQMVHNGLADPVSIESASGTSIFKIRNDGDVKMGGISVEGVDTTMVAGGGTSAADKLAANDISGLKNLRVTLNNQVAGRTSATYGGGMVIVRNITDKTYAIYVNTSSSATAGFTIIASAGGNWSTIYNTSGKEGVAYNSQGGGPVLFSQLNAAKAYEIITIGGQ